MVAQPRTAEYEVILNWGTGTDSDTSEFNDVSAAVLGPSGIAIQTGRDQIRAFSPSVIPSGDLDLMNDDQTYSPGGVLGSFVNRGPTADIRAIWGEDVPIDSLEILVNDPTVPVNGVVSAPLLSGHIDTIEHDLAWGHRVASVSILGQLTRLRDAAALTTALYENITISDALTVILDAVDWPADKRAISESAIELRYWWLTNADAFAAAEQLRRTEGAGAALYEDGSGVLHFEDRTYRSTAARSTTTQYTLWDSLAAASPNVNDPTVPINSVDVLVGGGGANSLYYTDLKITANPDEVVNEATATVIWRANGSLSQIWQAGTAFTLAADETRDFEINASDPFKSAATPVISTDYTVSAGSLASVTLSQTSGQSARLRLVAGVGGASVGGPTGSEASGIQVRAIPITERYQTTVRSTVDTTASQARYTGGKPKVYDLGLWPYVSTDLAQALVNDWVTRYQNPRTQVEVTLANLDGAHMAAMLALAVSDRCALINHHALLTIDVHVETLRHLISTGRLHRLTLGAELVASTPGVIDPGEGGGGEGGLPAQFGGVAPYAQFGTTHSFSE